jgi:predicted nuclease with TOPRIM domain
MDNISMLTNAEIKLKKKSLEDEYNAVKAQILSLTERMKELDKEYVKYDEEAKKRNGKTWTR